MNGQLGVLYQNGKQTGGIYDWAVNLAYDSTVRKGWQQVKVIKHILAQSYWLIELPDGTHFDIELYKYIQGQLVLMDAGEIAVKLPDIITLDRRLYAPLELKWWGPSEY